MTEVKEVVIVEGKLRKIVHLEGTGALPVKGQEVYALYRGTLEDGLEFDSNQDRENPFKFVLGQGQVIKGWDEGFASMRIGEKATLICAPEYAYGENGSPPKIPPNATLHFEVQLLDAKEKKKEKWQYSVEEKVAEATKLKENGNSHLKEGRFAQAISDYKEGIDLIESQATGKHLLSPLRLNLSLAYIKNNQPGEAVPLCSSVINDEPKNTKAFFRRGTACLQLSEFNNAKEDFKSVLEIDPENVEAKREIANLAQTVKAYKQKQKQVFGSMFKTSNGLYGDKKIQPPKAEEPKKIESDEEEPMEQETKKQE